MNRKIVWTPVKVYCVLSFLGIFVLICFFGFSKGELIPRYFFYDVRDVGMDFFHSIEYLNGASPYALYGTLYPPLANLLFYIFMHFIPIWQSELWPKDAYELVAMRGSDLDTRTWQPTMLLFIVMLILITYSMTVLVTCYLKSEKRIWANAVAFCMLFCPGMIMAFERGNIIVFAIVLTLIYIYFRNSENRYIREAALIALAAAAGLKLYTAFFGVLLLRDKQYKRAFRAVVYGILSVFLPMSFFKEKFWGLHKWIYILTAFGTDSEMPWEGYGAAAILHRAVHPLEIYGWISVNVAWLRIIGYIVALLVLLSALLMNKEWESVFTITLAIILFQSQGEYIYSFYCLPMLAFLRDEKKLNRENAFPFALLLACMIHLPLFYTRYIYYPNIFFKQIVSLLTLGWSSLLAIKYFYCQVYRKKRLSKQ